MYRFMVYATQASNFQTSTVQPLKLENGYVISSYT